VVSQSYGNTKQQWSANPMGTPKIAVVSQSYGNTKNSSGHPILWEHQK